MTQRFIAPNAVLWCLNNKTQNPATCRFGYADLVINDSRSVMHKLKDRVIKYNVYGELYMMRLVSDAYCISSRTRSDHVSNHYDNGTSVAS